MSTEEAEILRIRAEEFLLNAERLCDEGFYDLCVFNLEQFCQLMLKYKLLIKTGAYPRTHSLVRLLRDLSMIHQEVSDLLTKEEQLIMLTKLEDAYISARYFPRRYEPIEAKALLRFVKEVFKPVVERV